MEYPGTNKQQSFILQFNEDWLRKGEIITEGTILLEVTKVYRRTWWKRLLLWLGFKVKMYCVKVKPRINDSHN